MFTFKMSVLSDLVEDARRRYIEATSPNVTVHLMDRVKDFHLMTLLTVVDHVFL
jgi:hypothetical protein